MDGHRSNVGCCIIQLVCIMHTRMQSINNKMCGNAQRVEYSILFSNSNCIASNLRLWNAKECFTHTLQRFGISIIIRSSECFVHLFEEFETLTVAKPDAIQIMKKKWRSKSITIPLR